MRRASGTGRDRCAAGLLPGRRARRGRWRAHPAGAQSPSRRGACGAACRSMRRATGTRDDQPLQGAWRRVAAALRAGQRRSRVPPGTRLAGRRDCRSARDVEADRPGYSAFDGRTPAGDLFLTDLRARGIDTLYVAGIATDYCVRQTVLDARRAGLGVTVLTDAIAGIDATPGDVERALAAMTTAGAELRSELPITRDSPTAPNNSPD